MKKFYLFLSLFIMVFLYIIINQNIPLSFKEENIDPEALNYITILQKEKQIDPKEIAVKYYYYKSDYHEKSIPQRVIVKSKQKDPEKVLVTIYDPSCEDDSVYESFNRFILINDNDIWIPIKHDWAHKGRGTFGFWTTEYTN